LAKISLSKTIEAKKLNKRTGLAESGPDVTISFGALVEYVQTERDTVKFLYAGEPYRCAEDVWLSATRESAASAAKAEAPAAATAAPASAAAPAESAKGDATAAPGLTWEVLSSSQFRVARAKVPGGWLVAADGVGLAFYPDSEHGWDGKSVD
jgi:hypothetical protein